MEDNTYPQTFNTGFLKVSNLHSIYYEESGNPQGIPLLRIHGGPGNASKPEHRQYFDPKKFRIILYDQRGCGKSTPQGEIKENTIDDLIKDIESLRLHLKIDQFIIVGASWGTTVALHYAINYPSSVKQVILVGVFTASQYEIEWLYNNQIPRTFFPEYWESLAQFFSAHQKEPSTHQLYKLYETAHTETKANIIKMCARWERILGSLVPPKVLDIEVTAKQINTVDIKSHYILNRYFLSPEYIFNNISKISHIPITIIHGRYDLTCPVSIALRLKQSHQNTNLIIEPLAGHYSGETKLVEHLTQALERIN